MKKKKAAKVGRARQDVEFENSPDMVALDSLVTDVLRVSKEDIDRRIAEDKQRRSESKP